MERNLKQLNDDLFNLQMELFEIDEHNEIDYIYSEYLKLTISELEKKIDQIKRKNEKKKGAKKNEKNN